MAQAGTYLTPGGLKSIDPSKVSKPVVGVYVGPSYSAAKKHAGWTGNIPTEQQISKLPEEEVKRQIAEREQRTISQQLAEQQRQDSRASISMPTETKTDIWKTYGIPGGIKYKLIGEPRLEAERKAQERAEKEAGILGFGKWDVPFDIGARRETAVPTSIKLYTPEELGGGIWGGTGMPGGAAILLGKEQEKEMKGALDISFAKAEKELFPTYQSMVTETTTEAELGDINKMFQKAVETKTYETAGLKDIETKYDKLFKNVGRESLGIGIVEAVPKIGITAGAIVGASLLFPPTIVSTASIGIGAVGLASVYSSPTSISTTMDIKTGAILKESYTLPATLKMAGYGGLVLGGAYGLTKSTAQDITKIRIQDIQEMKPVNVGTLRADLGKDMFADFSQNLRQTASSKMITNTLNFGKTGQAGTFNVAGMQESFIQTTDFWTGGKLTLGSGQKFIGAGKMFSGDVSASLSQIKYKPTWDFSKLEYGKKSFANINLYRQAPTETFNIAGISWEKGDIVRSISGVPKYLYKTETGFDIGFNAEQFGLTKIIKPEFLRIFSKGGAESFGTGSITKTISRTVSSSVGASQINIPSFKTISLPAVIPSFKQGQLTKQSTRQISSVIPVQNFIQIQKTRERGALIPRGMFKTPTASRLKQPQLISPAQFQIPRTAQVTRRISSLRISPFSRAPFSSAFSFPSLKVPFVPFLPRLPEIGWGEKLGKSFKTRRTFKYSPSIGAVLVGFKVPKMTKAVKFAEISGFLPRPIISGSKKKKKK